MKKNHPNKVLRQKSSVSRGKQATRRYTVEFGFQRAVSAALFSSFGIGIPAQQRCKSISAFIQKKCKAIKQRPRSVLKEFKSHLTKVKLDLLAGKHVGRLVLGQILPRTLSKSPKFGTLLQYCRLGRALPKVKPDPKDLSDQIDRMTQKFDLPVPERVNAVLDMIQWPVARFVESLPSDFVSSSSCLEATRKNGGRTSLLVKSGISFGPLKDVWNGLTKVDRHARMIADGMLSDQFSVETDCVPLAIPELGAKVRIVTKHHSALVALSHRSRRLLWPLLSAERNITVSESIQDPILSILKYTKKRSSKKDYKVFSADLSAATDFLGWPVIDEICKRAGIPRSHVSPTSVGGVPVCRGTAMGLPASWPVLSLAHYAVCRAVDRTHSFRIKGDDLIALWSEEEIKDYYALCAEIGFVPNKSKSVISEGWGMFCEVTYIRHDNCLYRQKDFSIRSFVKNEPLAAEQWMMLEKHGADLGLLHRLFKAYHLPWIRMAHKAKINPFMPRRLGGLGFPPKKFEKNLSRRDATMVNVVHNGLLPCLIEDKPQTSAVKMYADFAQEHIKWTCGKGSHFLTHMLKTVEGRLFARGAFVDALQGNIPKTEMRHRDVVRQIGGLKKRILGQTRKYHPTTYADAYKILDRLQVSQGSDVLSMGASHWLTFRCAADYPMNVLHERYDEAAAAHCGRGNHLNSTCTVDFQKITMQIR